MKAGEYSNGHGAPSNGTHTDALQKTSATTSVQEEETVRLIIQALGDMGYVNAVESLSKESGVKVESALVEDFRRSILDADWQSAEDALKQLELNDTANTSEVLFLIREQKFLELLETSDSSKALMTLRTELSPLRHNIDRLHFLSSLIMANSPEELRFRANWSGHLGDSRRVLLRRISSYISPNSMIPEARLAALLNAARHSQVEDCLYHTSSQPISFLIPNHKCSRNVFPLHTSNILRDHSDEVWHVQYSPRGNYLASTGADGLIVIYETRTMQPIHYLNRRSADELRREKKEGKLKGIMYITFSPDETFLMTCSQDNVIVLWDVRTGSIMNQITNSHAESVSSACWLPREGDGFVSAGLDKKIVLYDERGSVVHVWETERIYDVKVSANGKYVVAISTESGVYVFDIETKERIALLHIQFELTSVNISADSSRMIISCSPTVQKGRSNIPKSQAMEIQEWSLPDLHLLRKVSGQRQGEFVIRSCYGGYAEQFILSGSEDCDIYLWHRKTGTLLERISGHSKAVGSVAWNPVADQWASASDDKTVRVWNVNRSAAVHDTAASINEGIPTESTNNGQALASPGQVSNGALHSWFPNLLT